MLRTISEKLINNSIVSAHLVRESFGHKSLEEIEANPGKVVVITGGSKGLGLCVTKHLLKLEYFVIIGCRNTEEAQQNLSEFKDFPGKYLVLYLDLQSLDSVRSFADNVRKEAKEIDILINNAGIMLTPYKETKDGFEQQFQINYLSHFLLTSLLLDIIQKRIVNVSSCAHKLGYYCTDWEDLQKKKFYTPEGAYGTSKVANVLFSKYLQAKINESPIYKDKISVFSLHPGMIYTDLYVNAPTFLFKPLANTVMKSTDQGAEAILHAALSKELDGQGGAYTENSTVVESSAFSSDLDNQKKLWDMSLQYLNLQKFADGLE